MADEIFVNTGTTFQQPFNQRSPSIVQTTTTAQRVAQVATNTQQPYPYIANTTIAYPYIANAQTSYTANAQQPYPYTANSQTSYTADAQQPYPYTANSQTSYTANAQQPYPYIANTTITYPYIANGQTTYTADAQQPYPYIANSQTSYTADAQQPYPYTANSQTPYPANAQQPYPYTANAQQAYPYTANSQTPYIANAQQPYPYIATSQTPYIASGQQPANSSTNTTINITETESWASGNAFYYTTDNKTGGNFNSGFSWFYTRMTLSNAQKTLTWAFANWGVIDSPSMYRSSSTITPSYQTWYDQFSVTFPSGGKPDSWSVLGSRAVSGSGFSANTQTVITNVSPSTDYTYEIDGTFYSNNADYDTSRGYFERHQAECTTASKLVTYTFTFKFRKSGYPDITLYSGKTYKFSSTLTYDGGGCF